MAVRLIVYISVILVTFTLVVTTPLDVIARQKGKSAKVTSPKAGAKAPKGKSKKRYSAPPKLVKSKSIADMVIQEDSLVNDGMIYRLMQVRMADSSITYVHALTCVMRNPPFSVMTLKCENRCDGMERMVEAVQRVDSAENKKIIAAVNANFWKAVSNAPIGPAVCNGEVIEMLPYKDWNSCFFEANGRPAIDTFRLKARIRNTSGDTAYIHSVNHRVLPDSIVLFNSFVGPTVPYIPKKKIDKLVDEILSDSVAVKEDSATFVVNRDSIENALLQLQQEANAEYQYTKILCRYLRPPAVNQEIPLMVLKKIDSGSVNMPIRGCVLSMKKSIAKSLYVMVGDTIFLRYSTNKNDSIVYHNAVCGTPRLVIRGDINEELENDHQHSARFMNTRLPRTAIGTDITRSTLYIVTVEASSRSRGFTIMETADFMKQFGAYHALNLDGGGSTHLMLGDTLLTPSPNVWTRKLSYILALGRKKGTNKIQPIRKED